MTSARSILTASSAALLLLACAAEPQPVSDAPETVDVPASGPAASPPAKSGRVMASSPLAPLQGDWIGADDPRSGLRIDGTRFILLHDGAETEAFGLSLVADCAARAPTTTLSALTLDDADGSCYSVIEATPDALVLAPANGRGNTLRYTRAD